MEPVFPDYVFAGALLPSHPWWRAVAWAVGGWASPPKLTYERVRLDHRCKALYTRAAAKLLEAERTRKKARPAAACAAANFQLTSVVAPYPVSARG